MERYPQATGWLKGWGLQRLLGWWQHMRLAGISTFGEKADMARRCPFVHADSGTLGGTLHVIGDPRAVEGRSVQAEAGPAAATYEITVLTGQVYKLCCRWQTPASGALFGVPLPGPKFGVSVDGGPVMEQGVPVGPEYVPCVLAPMMTLEAGTHRFRITWPGPGSRLDVLELTPQ